MKIEVWSDVMCPFCYIGKRRLEMALEQFSSEEEISITWKSFLLNPDLKTDLSKTTLEYLSESKGMPLDEVKQMFTQVTRMAKEVGLDYDLENTVVASSFNAHRFLHYALKEGKQLAAKELIFKAHFLESKNIDDVPTLIEIGAAVGLDAERVKEVLLSDEYEQAVKYDIYEAQQLGVRGVPFFVFNNKFGISGAQPLEVFLETLEKASKE
jgi:predicted DsbA family dithiol-disulfide isomerase